MHKPTIKICPSILSADFKTLEAEVKNIHEAGADMIHCDIMDGCFVPNISFGPMVVETVRRCVPIPLDVHLMIINPIRYIKDFRNAGADIITVHADACDNLPATLDAIHTAGAQAGVTVNPDKPIDLFMPLLDHIDQVLIMSVYAGFGGQKFIPDVLSKVTAVRAALRLQSRCIDLQIDGGIGASNVRLCSRAGANLFVAGSYLFSGKTLDEYRKRILLLKQEAQQGLDEWYETAV